MYYFSINSVKAIIAVKRWYLAVGTTVTIHMEYHCNTIYQVTPRCRVSLIHLHFTALYIAMSVLII